MHIEVTDTVCSADSDGLNGFANAGDDQEFGTSGVYGFKFIPRSSPTCEMGRN